MSSLIRALWICALISGSAQGAQATKTAIPILAFVRHDAFGQLKLSPDGKYLATTVWANNEYNLTVMDFATMKPMVSHFLPAEDEISDFYWVNNDRLVYSGQREYGGYAKPQPSGEIFAMDADGGHAVSLFGNRSGDTMGTLVRKVKAVRASGYFLDHIPGDHKNILITAFPWSATGFDITPSVYRLNVYTGRKKRIAGGPGINAQFLADPNGNIRFAVTPGRDLIPTVFYREGAGIDWKPFAMGKQAMLGDTFIPIAFNADGSQVYALSDVGAATIGLVSFNLAQATQRLIFRDPVVDIVTVLYDADRRDVYAVLTDPALPATHTCCGAPAVRKLQKQIDIAFSGQRARIASMSADGKKAIIDVRNDRNPGDFYLYDGAHKKLSYLLSRRDWLDPAQMAAVKPISLTARDGTRLHGYLTLPTAGKDTSLPAIIIPHGGPHGIRDRWEFNPEVQLLASRGYAVLQINYRGSGGYGKAFQAAGYRHWGTLMQDDVTDATHWLVDQGIADGKRLCIYGGSYGGYAALMGVVREPDLYRCAVGIAGVYDLSLMFDKGDIQQSWGGTSYLRLVVGEDEADLKARSPVYHADVIKAKVMLVHGGADRRVPLAHAKAMRDALIAAGNPPLWLSEADEGHGFYREDHLENMYRKVLAFLDTQIGAGRDPMPSKSANRAAP